MSARFSRLTTLCLAASLYVSAPVFAQAPLPKSPPATGKPATPAKQLTPAAQKAVAQYDRAAHLQRARKAPEAIAAYKTFLRLAAAAKFPPKGTLPAYVNLAILYTEQRRFAEAKQAANRALELSPPPELAAPLHFALGNVALAKNDLTTAAKEFGLSARQAPKNAQAHLNLGFALARQKKYKPALAALERARKLQPKLTQAEFYIAALKQEMRDVPGAIAAYEVVLKEEPRHPQALLNRALLLHQLGKTQEAITTYLAALEVRPNSFAAHLNVGQLYYSLDNFTAAKQHFEAAHKLDPKNFRALTSLAYAQMQSAGALPNLTARDAGFKQAETTFKQALALAPKDTPTQSGLGFLYQRMGRYDDALAIFRKLRDAAPDDVTHTYQIAQTYTAQRNVERVLETWREYRARKPDDPVSYEEAARTLEAAGRYDQALAEWRLLLARKPDVGVTGGALAAMARDLIPLKRAAEARTQFQAVLALDSSGKGVAPKKRNVTLAALKAARMEALRGLARLAVSEGKTQEAVAWWNKVKEAEVAESVKTGHAPDPQTYLEIARLYEQAKNLELAAEEYRALARVAPTDPTPHAKLAELYAKQGHLEQAIAAYRAAVERASDPTPYRLEIADLYRRNKQLDKALAEYEALRTENPNDIRIYDPLARAYEQAGQDEKALAAYEALAKREPTFRWVEGRKAVILTRLKRYDAARALYEKQQESNPDDLQVYADLANLYKLEGRPDAFLPWLKARFEKTPASGALLTALLDEFARQQKAEAGWAYLREAAEKRKTDRRFLESYAGLLAQRNRKADALEVARQIAAQNPKDIAAQSTLIAQLDANGKPEEATRINEALVALADLPVSQRTGLRRRLAQRYAKAGRSAEAIAQYQEIVKAVPTDFVSTLTLAQLLTEAGRYTDAASLYLNLSQQNSYPPEMRAQFLVRLGGVYEKQGVKADAIVQYREALKMSPQNAEAAAALKRLGG